jgi:hypothetical protein
MIVFMVQAPVGVLGFETVVRSGYHIPTACMDSLGFCRKGVMLPSFIGERLQLLATDLPPSWQLWQYKSFNMHRGVIHWDATSTTCTFADIRDQVRTAVLAQYRPSWWRGFAFGVIVSLNHLDESFQGIDELVDVRNNSKGTWQWIVLHFPTLKTATGIQTWTDGYLAPVYNDLLAALQTSGFTCETHRKDMDALMKSLFAIQRILRAARRGLGGAAASLE